MPTLEFSNGYGGFAADGREYVVALEPGVDTPAPWVNVLANPGFGSVVSASGAAFSWAANSRENQLTRVVERSGQRSVARSRLPA